MTPEVKSLAARIGEHHKTFFAAGGKPRGLKYPVEWQTEAARLQKELKVPVADLARELGIGHGALWRWCKQESAGGPRSRSRLRSKSQPRPAKGAFVPLEIVPDSIVHASAPKRAPATQVTLREITVDIGPNADDCDIAAVVAMLMSGRRQAQC